MPTVAAGDVLIGGPLGYAEWITATAIHQGHVQAFDDQGAPLRVNGTTFSPAGVPFMALGEPGGGVDENPHDVDYVPGATPMLAALIARLDNTLECWLVDLDGNLIEKQVGLATDVGWTTDRIARCAVACDGRTLYYTDRLRTIFRWDIVDAVQLANFAQLTVDSPYVYGALDLARGGDVVVAMTGSGEGPRDAVAVGSTTTLWTDQINPSDDIYRVYKRLLEDGSDVLSHIASLDPDDTNTIVTALGANFWVCAARRHVSVWISG